MLQMVVDGLFRDMHPGRQFMGGQGFRPDKGDDLVTESILPFLRNEWFFRFHGHDDTKCTINEEVAP